MAGRLAAAAASAARRGLAADAAASVDEGRARRLAEMAASASSASASRRAALPSPEAVAALLRQAPTPESTPEPAPRDWRDALDAARALGLGADPLVDSFG
jgi:hypothetical protein